MGSNSLREISRNLYNGKCTQASDKTPKSVNVQKYGTKVSSFKSNISYKKKVMPVQERCGIHLCNMTDHVMALDLISKINQIGSKLG